MSPNGTPNSVFVSTASVLAPAPPVQPTQSGSTFGGGGKFDLSADEPASLGSPTGTGPRGSEFASNPLADLGTPGFTGAIGRPGADGEKKIRRRQGPGGLLGHGKLTTAGGPLTAPAAGFSIGRGPGGVVLDQSAVPKIAARPPAVTSSVINVQPSPATPAGGLNATAPAGLPGGGGQAPASLASSQPTAEGTTVAVGDRSVLGPGMAGATRAIGPGDTDVEGGMAMPPTGGMGGMGGMGGAGAGSGLGRAERERLSYLPQESRYWGTEPDLVTSLRSEDDDDDDGFIVEAFDAVPSRIAGIGARSEIEQRENAATDWRML